VRVIPVIDLLGGAVVRGVGGQRDKYRPIESHLVDSSEPLAVANAIRDYLGTSYIYIADLDAIRTGTLSRNCLEQLVHAGFDILLDAGAFQVRQVGLLLDLGIRDVVIALETLTDQTALAASIEKFGPDQVVFSLDLKANWPLMSDSCPWSELTPSQIAEEAVDLGVERMIVLDLHSIGRGSGIPTLPLCQRLLQSHPDLRLITGGGVRTQDDIDALTNEGLDGIMVASALHDGRLTRGA